jgi:serine/threonine-protein kinase
MSDPGCLDADTIAAMSSGTLPEAQQRRALEHLRHCDSCRRLTSLDTTLPSAAGDGVPLRGQKFAGYVIEETVGAGAMGVVYAALDEELGRKVALKILRQNDRDEKRLRREARITARLQHPSIVPIYEMGELPTGESFYSMKLVSGQSFQEVVGGAPTLDERLVLLPHVIAAADVMAYAHSERVIHRDLKPSNIMVGPFGETLVIDWGLAKWLGEKTRDPLPRIESGEVSAELTRHGTVLGTPAYMPPEQAAGETVEERADVYALGAILYFLLAGKPPYAGVQSGEEVLARVLAGPPAAIDAVEPGAPDELVAIIRHAMARDKAARYPSAREVADDLRRFETGQLVRAHRYSPVRLAYRWFAGRFWFRLAALVTVAAAVVVAIAQSVQHKAAERLRVSAARLRAVEELGPRVEQIDSRLRVAYLMPLHDTRSAVAQAKGELRRVEERLAAVGAEEYGPGRFALARAHLALRDFVAARAQLEQALRLDPRPEVSRALGRTLAELYGVALDELETVPAKQRPERATKLKQTLRDPALKQLAAAPDVSSASVRAIVALLEERYDEAVALAAQATAESPDDYDMRLVEGDAHRRRATVERLGGRYPAARRELELAGVAYQAAADVARSDPRVHRMECKRGIAVADVDRQLGAIRQSEIDRALAACARARTADPGMAAIYLDQAALHYAMGSADFGFGRDPRPAYGLAINDTELALRIDPSLEGADLQIARTLNNIADWESNHGLDAHASTERARHHLEAAIARRPTAQAYYALAISYGQEGNRAMDHGQPGAPLIRRAIELFRHALELEEYTGTHFNIAASLVLVAQEERDQGRDPGPSIAEARRELDVAMAKTPNYPRALIMRATGERIVAEHEWLSGGDGHAGMARALADDDRALTMPQTDSMGYYDRGATLFSEAEMLVAEGRDAKARIAEAREAMNKAIQVDATDYEKFQQLAEIELLEARTSPSAQAFAAAERALAEARRLNATQPGLRYTAAEIARWKAAWLAGAGRDSSAVLDEGMRAIDEAVAGRPGYARFEALRGALLWARARAAKSEPRKSEARAAARAAFDAALQHNPLVARRYREILDDLRAAAP